MTIAQGDIDVAMNMTDDTMVVLEGKEGDGLRDLLDPKLRKQF